MLQDGKKAVRYVFIGYDSQRKGWHFCDPATGKCYTSRNVVFDEASSWWPSNKEASSESDVFTDLLQTSQVQLRSDETNQDGEINEREARSLWQFGVYQQLSEEGDITEVETQIAPRRSMRIRKPNVRYANAAIVEEDATEP